MYTLVATGLRIGEAMGLTWAKVNAADHTVRIEGVRVPAHCAVINQSFSMGQYTTTKTAGSERLVVLPDYLDDGKTIPIWDRLVKMRERDREQIDGWTADCPVWATHKRTPINLANVNRRILKPIVSALGMPDVSWHWLRHTANTFLDGIKGLTMAEKQKMLGHTQAQTNLEYTHPQMESVRARVEGLLKSPEPPRG